MTRMDAQWSEPAGERTASALRRWAATETPRALARALALTFGILLLAATLTLRALDITARRESYIINLLGTLLFIGVASAIIAIISIRSFLRTGAWPVLWLGAGSLAFGVGVPLSNLLLAVVGANAGVTIHNLSAFSAGALHCVGAFFAVNGVPALPPGPRRRYVTIQVFGGALFFVAFAAVSAVAGILPPFFIEGVGGTALRQLIVALGALLFLTAGLVFLRSYALSRTHMLYWYALGLMLISLGLAGILMITGTGTPLNWLGRATQWAGGLYLLVAAVITWRAARARRIPTGDLLASYFLGREDNLRHLLNSIPDAIIVTDRDYRITFWNRGAEAIYGWSAEQATGRPARELIRAEWPDEALHDSTREALPGGWRAEVVEHLHTGREITVLSSISAVTDDTGRVIGAVAVNRDITDRRRAEEEIQRLNADLARRAAELEASNRELEAFAYSVSHDLRAPLRGIDGFSQALEEDCAAQLDETGRDYLRMLRQNAQRMGDLIDDLLSLSRVGRQQLQPQPVRIAELAQRAWEDLRADREGRAVEFRVGALPVCEADATLLRQLYHNLLSNALKFSVTRAPAVIEVGCSGQDAATGAPRAAAPVFFVRDNGIGFEMQYAEKIFGVFQRLHRAEEYEGTGVGLAIAQRVVQRHGGRMWVESSPGAGATFYFTLGGKLDERTDG